MHVRQADITTLPRPAEGLHEPGGRHLQEVLFCIPLPGTSVAGVQNRRA